MAKTKPSEIIVGLDIGTTKITCIAGEVTDEGIDIIGIGTAPSKGVRRGSVVNIDATVSSIRQAVDEAENMAGCEISTVYAAISGPHVRGFNKDGIVAVKDKEVRDADIARVIDAAKAVAIPMDREVLHVLPQQYVVDEQDGIRDPLGMAAVRLEAKVHIVTTAVAAAQNVVKCANRCNLQVADLALGSLASAQAVLEEDEKELGVALVDVGGGTCDIMVFEGGAIVHTSVLALGGGHITSDIAVGLRTPLDAAERLKRKYGSAWHGNVDDGERMEVPSTGGRGPRALPRIKLVKDVIEPRVTEIFEFIKEDLLRSGYFDSLAAGVVLTGGATAMDGVTEIAEQVLELPCRRGAPIRIGGLVDVVRSPAYATGVGLVMFGAEQGKSVPLPVRDERPGMFKRAWNRIAEIF